jgi:hypothetical protein
MNRKIKVWWRNASNSNKTRYGKQPTLKKKDEYGKAIKLRNNIKVLHCKKHTNG